MPRGRPTRQASTKSNKEDEQSTVSKRARPTRPSTATDGDKNGVANKHEATAVGKRIGQDQSKVSKEQQNKNTGKNGSSSADAETTQSRKTGAKSSDENARAKERSSSIVTVKKETSSVKTETKPTSSSLPPRKSTSGRSRNGTSKSKDASDEQESRYFKTEASKPSVSKRKAAGVDKQQLKEQNNKRSKKTIKEEEDDDDSDFDMDSSPPPPSKIKTEPKSKLSSKLKQGQAKANKLSESSSRGSKRKKTDRDDDVRGDKTTPGVKKQSAKKDVAEMNRASKMMLTPKKEGGKLKKEKADGGDGDGAKRDEKKMEAPDEDEDDSSESEWEEVEGNLKL